MVGWVFAADMIGAAVGAAASGAQRAASGGHTLAWLLAGALALVTAAESMGFLATGPAALQPA